MKLNRTRIGSAAVAALAALVLAGCGYGALAPPPAPPTVTEPAAWETLFDLAEHLAELEVGETDRAVIFPNTVPLSPADAGGTSGGFAVIEEGGVRAIQVTQAANWNGFDINHAAREGRPGLDFEPGDRITIAGRAHGANTVILGFGQTPWRLHNWEIGGTFTQAFVLTSADIAEMVDREGPDAVRFRSGEGSAAATAGFTITQILVERPAEAPDETEPDVTVPDVVVEEVIGLTPFAELSTMGTTVFTLVRQGTEFIELRMTGRTADNNGLFISLTELINAGILSPGDTYTVWVRGRADDTAAESADNNFHIRANWNDDTGIAPFAAGQTFRAQRNFTPVLPGADATNLVRLMSDGAGNASANLILTRVVIYNASNDVVWSLADTLVPPPAPNPNVITVREAWGRTTILAGVETLSFGATAGLAQLSPIWTVTPGNRASINSAGQLTVPHDTPAGTTLIVRARAGGVSGTATVTVTGLSVSVAPGGPVLLAQGDYEDFAVTIVPANNPATDTPWTVAWIADPAIGGTIAAPSATATRFTVAPAAAGTIDIRATVGGFSWAYDEAMIVVLGDPVVLAYPDDGVVLTQGTGTGIQINAFNFDSLAGQTVNFGTAGAMTFGGSLGDMIADGEVTVSGSIAINNLGLGTGTLTLTFNGFDNESMSAVSGLDLTVAFDGYEPYAVAITSITVVPTGVIFSLADLMETVLEGNASAVFADLVPFVTGNSATSPVFTLYGATPSVVITNRDSNADGLNLSIGAIGLNIPSHIYEIRVVGSVQGQGVGQMNIQYEFRWLGLNPGIGATLNPSFDFVRDLPDHADFPGINNIRVATNSDNAGALGLTFTDIVITRTGVRP